ncbi:acyl-CoA dehydrogenase [Actinobacteria bacterium IMCC26207]|nr:acyl-CoA dehydrogenase [Actinobacteria bacterium IMCC26207]
MRFALTEDQVEFRAVVRGLLADTCGPDELRAAWPDAETAGGGPGGGNGRVPGAWSALAEMGVLGIMVPEAQGGLAMTEEDLVPLLLEAGWAGLPDPLAATAGVAVTLLRHASSSEPRADELLAQIAAGEISLGCVFSNPAQSESMRPASVVAVSNFIPAATSLDQILLCLEDSVHLVDPASLQLERVQSVDGARDLFHFVVPVEMGESTALLTGAAAQAATLAAFDFAALGAAAELIGLSRRMLEMTILYATERKQFGVQIGSFQAVKHHLTNASLAVEFAEPLVLRAANSLALGNPQASLHVSMAKAKASAAAKGAAAASLQVHGAIGYTVEYDLHLYMKRSWALAGEFGDVEFHRRRVSAELLAK